MLEINRLKETKGVGVPRQTTVFTSLTRALRIEPAPPSRDSGNTGRAAFRRVGHRARAEPGARSKNSGRCAQPGRAVSEQELVLMELGNPFTNTRRFAMGIDLQAGCTEPADQQLAILSGAKQIALSGGFSA